MAKPDIQQVKQRFGIIVAASGIKCNGEVKKPGGPPEGAPPNLRKKPQIYANIGGKAKNLH